MDEFKFFESFKERGEWAEPFLLGEARRAQHG
jgi:hypothetical protein